MIEMRRAQLNFGAMEKRINAIGKSAGNPGGFRIAAIR